MTREEKRTYISKYEALNWGKNWDETDKALVSRILSRFDGYDVKYYIPENNGYAAVLMGYLTVAYLHLGRIKVMGGDFEWQEIPLHNHVVHGEHRMKDNKGLNICPNCHLAKAANGECECT